MQDFVGALEEALLGGDAAHDPDAADANDGHSGDFTDQEIQPQVPEVPQPTLHIDLVDTRENAFRSGAEMIVQRCGSFKLWHQFCRPHRRSKFAKALQPLKLSLVEHNGVVQFWHWQRGADVVWNTQNNVVFGNGTPVRLDTQQRAIYPIHFARPDGHDL